MTLVIMAVTVILAGISLSYKQIGNHIKDKENENEQPFVSTYFRYITELGIDDKDFEVMAKRATRNGTVGHYVPLDAEKFVDILKLAL